MATNIIGPTESYITKGPAVIRPDGGQEHWIKGKELTEAEFKTWQTQQSAPR